MNSKTQNNDPMYMLAALIEIYRGVPVIIPDFDPEMEKNILMDLFSSAISFAQADESRRVLSEEINRCAREGASVKEQLELAESQGPDVLYAKMVAAAHLMKIMEGSKYKFS